VAGALVPHSRQEPAPGMAGRSMRPHARVWILPGSSRLRSRTAGNPNGAICAEPPTLMVQEAGVPIRRSGAGQAAMIVLAASPCVIEAHIPSGSVPILAISGVFLIFFLHLPEVRPPCPGMSGADSSIADVTSAVSTGVCPFDCVMCSRARENMCGRFNLALGAEAAGFGEGHSLRGTSLRRARRLITWMLLSEQGRWCAGPARSRRRWNWGCRRK
jgi:hypothetical protein